MMKSKKYDIALSFASEDKQVAKDLALSLMNFDLRVFIDEWATNELWGKDLHEYLSTIYNDSSVTIILLSSHYLEKQWTLTELTTLRNSSVHNPDHTILPIKIDDSSYPHMISTIGYIDLRQATVKEIAELIKKKIKDIPQKSDPLVKHLPKTYHVIPRFYDWAVKKSGASRATAIYKTKQEAIDKAKKLVKKSESSQIVIHKSDGTIEKKLPDMNTKRSNNEC